MIKDPPLLTVRRHFERPQAAALDAFVGVPTGHVVDCMDGAGARYPEVPYSVIDARGRVEQGAIDALFHDQDGWTLVEFKTDRIAGRVELETRLAEADYVPQVARYLEAAARMLGARPRPVLCLLNLAGAVHTVEDRW